MSLSGPGKIDGALGRGGKRRFVDVEVRDLAAKDRIYQPALRIGSDRIGRDLT